MLLLRRVRRIFIPRTLSLPSRRASVPSLSWRGLLVAQKASDNLTFFYFHRASIRSSTKFFISNSCGGMRHVSTRLRPVLRIGGRGNSLPPEKGRAHQSEREKKKSASSFFGLSRQNCFPAMSAPQRMSREARGVRTAIRLAEAREKLRHWPLALPWSSVTSKNWPTCL